MKFFRNIKSLFVSIYGCFLFSSMLPFAMVASDMVFNVSDLPESFPSPSNPLWNYQDREVQVRGFWYPLSADQGILAPTPNLKSCCVGAPKKVNQQLVVRGYLPSSYDQQVVAVKGIFRIEPQYDTKGQLTQLYVLEGPQEVAKESFPLSLILIFGGLSVGAVYFIRARAQEKK